MNCDDIIELYQKLLRSELLPDELQMLEGHVSKCKECQNALSWDRAMVSALQRAEPVAPREDFVTEVFRHLPQPNVSLAHKFVHEIVIFTALIFAGAGMALLWFGLLQDMQPDFISITMRYSGNLIDNLKSFSEIVSGISFSQDIWTAIPAQFAWLFWIVFAGSTYFIVSALFPLVPYSVKK